MLKELPSDLGAPTGAVITGIVWLALLAVAVAIGSGTTDADGFAGSEARLVGVTAYASEAVRVGANSRRHSEEGDTSR